jgi:two-component system sensor histidine kinase YesM
MGKRKTIKKKLFISYRNLIVSIMMAFSVFLFAYIFNIITQQTRDMMTSLLTAGINQTDMEVRKMDTVSLNISYSNLIKNNFEKLINEKDGAAYNALSRSIVDALISINGPLMPVQQMNIYSMAGQVLSTGFSNKSITTDLASKKWYEDTLVSGGKKYIHALKDGRDAFIYDTTGYDTEYIALGRVISNKYEKQLGILEVITKNKLIFKSIKEIEDEYKGSVVACLFDEYGSRLYPFDPTKESRIEYEQFITHVKDEKEGFFKIKLEEEPYHIYYRNSEYTGWTLVLARKEKSVNQPIITLVLFMIGITSLFIGMALLISLMIAKDFCNPIGELLQIIKNTKLKNLNHIEKNSINTNIIELEELDEAFNTMRKDMKYSTEAMLEAQRQELKARMLALQSQMNPHFLYNTLANISVMAEEGFNEGIIEMCDHVSFLLRYFSASKPVLVKVKEEFQCAEKFLAVAKIRYKEHLSYTVELSPQIQELDIPRNIVQPLVENAVKYGVNGEMMWHIKLEGYLEDGGWRIKISDKGDGFWEEKLRMLEEKIHNINTRGEYIDLEINGMGFINVFSRLKLIYEDHMIFEFGNDPGGGAVIVIGVRGS